MALRPIAFSIPSTTELKITFSDSLSEKISKENFEVESLGGAVSDLEVTGVTLDGKVALVKTRPHVSGNYYLLKFLDTTDIIFASEKGERLLDDSISRELFFVGIDKVNPIRDRLLDNVPQLFDVENTTLREIISVQADEMLKAQIAISRNLSNNYISIEVEDEVRVRGPGASDRMANENAYEVTRISEDPSTSLSKYDKLEYTSDNDFENLQAMPFFPVALQQALVKEEEISPDSEGNSFDGYLLSLAKNNVIRILSVLHIRNGEIEDCDGNLGDEYDLDKHKYTILSNRYDQLNAFSFSKLKSNQVLLSEFGNISRPGSLDTIKVSYLYKDLGRYILENSVSVSKIKSVVNEPVPSNAVSFFLDNAPVVDSSNDVFSSKGGVTFKLTEKSDETPPEFATEVLFGSSRMPLLSGEYSVNYETGEVFVLGVEIGEGTARNNYVMDYNYRKEFSQDVDYSIDGQDLVGHPDRSIISEEAEIEINYDKVFAEGTDYKVSSHIEVINEQVENNLSGSFSVLPQNAPVTDVFRILNQTTGEIYNPLYHSDTEIFFSGNRSPEIIEVNSEVARFERVINEELEVIGAFVSPAFTVEITSTASINSTQFTPGIPAELITFTSDSYFVRGTTTNDDVVIEDTQIKFFGDPDSNNLITSFAMNSAATPPSSGSTVIIGLNTYQIYLDQEGIMNNNLDALGSLVNSSISFSEKTLFLDEKYFSPVSSTGGIDDTTDGGISKALTIDKTTDFYENLSRLRKIGDYAIDYENGIVYLATSNTQNITIGNTSYNYFGVKARNGNVLDAAGAAKKSNSPDLLEDARIIYDLLSNDTEIIKILDIEQSTAIWEEDVEAADLDGEFQTIYEVLEDYTIVVPHDVQSILSINKVTDLTGTGLDRNDIENRVAESSASDLLKIAADGGKNLYDNSIVTFEKNVIDLKTIKERRAYANSDGDFVITIYDSNVSSLHKVVEVKTELDLFDDKLNITKFSGIKVVAAESAGSGAATAFISTDDLDDIDASGDFLLDSDGNRFEITAADTTLSTLTLVSPAINNSNADLPELDSSGEGTAIVVKPTVDISGGVLTITIPSDAPINSGDVLRVIYLTTLIPDVGEALAIDFRYGFVYVDYNYVKDKLSISYEYGDNQIDWSISDARLEGDSYYVSYRYGAGREALRANFGSLTDIPFFGTFPLNIDRELYRDAISGTLQAFPKGPTIPAFEDLVKSFTKINPAIDEMIFGNWILGRDHLHIDKPQFSGDLEFQDGKFEDGLLFQEDTTVDIPAISSLALEEGTVEGWVRPNWSGIDNDADLTFSIDNLGKQKFFTDPKDKLFASGWDIPEADDLQGGIDDTGLGFRFFNYRSDDSVATGLAQGYFALVNQINHYNEATDSIHEVRIKLPYAAIRHHSQVETYELESSYTFTKFGMLDGTKLIGGELVLKELFEGTSFNTSEYDISSTNLPQYDRPHYLRSCSCSITDNVALLEKFNSEIIEIDLGVSIDFKTHTDKLTLIDFVPESLVVIDTTGTHWQVIGFELDNGDIVNDVIPSSARKVLVERFPINGQHMSQQGRDAINANLPSGLLNIYAKAFRVSSTSNSSSLRAFSNLEYSMINWSEYKNIKLVKILKDNIVDIRIDGAIFKFFYSDLEDAVTLPLTTMKLVTQPFGGILSVPVNNLYAEVQIFRNRITVENRYSLSDVYIGRDGYNPTTSPFTINREDSPKTSIGLPKNIDTDDGIFIGYDELCVSPLSDIAGQWIFRARSTRGLDIPDGVVFHDDGTYTSIFTTFEVDHKFSGEIDTDGAFSSVVRASRDEIDGCTDAGECSASFRYCSEELLENIGWVNLEEVDSDLINVILGGRETFYEPWIKVGDFLTTVSDGIYRMSSADPDECKDENGNFLYTRIPCGGGNIEFINSMRVAQVDTDIQDSGVGTFSGAVSGVITGIVPIHIANTYADIKIVLGVTSTAEPLVIIYDNSLGMIVDYISYDWNDNAYHEYKVVITESTQIVQLYVDELLLSQVSISEFDTPESMEDPKLAVHVLDGDILSVAEFNAANESNIIDVDLIEYSGNNFDGTDQLESTDIFVNTDSNIRFEFNIDSLDGYFDAYGSSDGYIVPVVGVDEILMSADSAKYFIDSAMDDHHGRISIFKDGKGFLNFRIYDESLSLGQEVGMYNLGTNIKHWVAGELHHIAASWKLNSIDEQDEMHLFVDGIEAPNIYKFGGTVPLKVNAKFSDVSKETLHNFLVDDIEFCDTYTEGTVSAGGTSFSSSKLTFTDDMVGRSILITGSTIGSNLINGEYIIKSVVGGAAILGSGSSFETITFSVSASDIEFKFPPTAGLLSPVLTDLRNSKFTIYRTLSDSSIEELGGILYEVSDGEIDIISGTNIEKPQFRANLDTRVVEFVGEDGNCDTVATVLLSDIDIHLETFGLNLQRCKQILDLSASSYLTDDSPHSGKSVARVYGTEPLSLADVKLTRIIMDRTVIDIGGTELRADGNYLATFSISLDKETNNVSSNPGRVNKQDLGRLLNLWFDSDNIVFCDTDGYTDGYVTGGQNLITVYGETTDNADEETFIISRNGYFSGELFFTDVDRIEGSVIIADPDYFELGVVSIEEVNPITVSDNSGDYAEIFDYQNGTYTITTQGSNGLFPFELHQGKYRIDYPSYLRVSVPQIGSRLYIGSDNHGEHSWDGVIDEFRIISELSSDTRSYETETAGTRSITKDFNTTNPFCADEQTLALIHFNNPIEQQNRKLRTKEYLDEDNNVKFKLTVSQREELLTLIGSSDEFVSAMIHMGFDQDMAEKTYYEALYAGDGPIMNKAFYYNNFSETQIGSESVNDSFGKSGYFKSGSGLLFDNDLAHFRASEGTIEFWVSPVLDTKIDQDRRYYVDIADIKRERIKSESSTIIELPNPASEVVSVKLLTAAARFESMYSDSEINSILFDEISRREISGRLEGGTGVDKDFSIGSKLSADGKTIHLSDALPGQVIDVVVTYIPLDSSGDRVSIFKNEYSQIVFGITADGVDNVVTSDVNWKKNTWHRVMCVYKTGTKSSDTMRIFVDGVEGGIIRYGTGLIYGTGYIYGQYIQNSGQAKSKDYRIDLGSEFRIISIGSDVYGDNTARSRLDNMRFSRIMRNTTRDSLGNFVDTNYSSNTDTIFPVVEDDATSFILDFDADGEKLDKFATIIDPKNGIFDFDILIIDNFDKVVGKNDGEVEDLIIDLVDRLKPAHSNALVKFVKSEC